MTNSGGRVAFGQFRVLQREDGSLWEMGRGAMGVTYRAVNTVLDSPVALKVIDSSCLVSDEVEKRFVREARAMAGLRHKNIASVYHLAKEDGQYFYTMELLNGETAQEFVGRCGPLQIDAALRLTSQICLALAAAAREQLVHRDVKPANIMILVDADEDHWPFVKLIDFGVARSLSADKEASYATLPGFVGTAQFASPEQIQEQPVDAKADIYSLGCTLWFLLTGSPPFEGSLASVFSHHLQSEPPWKQLRDCPKCVVDLVAWMLKKDPALRPNALEAKREAERCLAEVSRPESRNAGPTRAPLFGCLRPGVLAQPRLGLIAGAAFALLLLVLGPALRGKPAPQFETALASAALSSAKPPARTAAKEQFSPIPRWVYLASDYPPSQYLTSSRPLSLSKVPIPDLEIPGSPLWIADAADNPFAEPLSLSDVAMLARAQDLKLNDSPPPKGTATRQAAPADKSRDQSFRPRQEIERARRNIEKKIRRFF